MGHLTAEETEQLLQKTVIGRIGCCDGQLTYVVPISYAYEEGYVYCHTREGLKIDILRKNPLACFEVDNLDDLANWQSVIAQGHFEELTDPAERLAALEKLYARKLPTLTSQTTMLTTEWPFASEQLSQLKGVTFRLRLHHKSGRFEKHSPTSDTFF